MYEIHLWSVLPSEATLVSMGQAATRVHVGVHVLFCPGGDVDDPVWVHGPTAARAC